MLLPVQLPKQLEVMLNLHCVTVHTLCTMQWTLSLYTVIYIWNANSSELALSLSLSLYIYMER